MRFFIKAIFIGLLAYFGELYFDWWWIAVAAFFGGSVYKTSGAQSFFSGAFGIGIVWLWAAARIDSSTESILTRKIAELFGLGHGVAIILITMLIGSLMGAIAAWTGHNLRKLIDSRQRRGYY